MILTLVFQGPDVLTDEFRRAAEAGGGDVTLRGHSLSIKPDALAEPDDHFTWALHEARRLGPVLASHGVEVRRVHFSNIVDVQLSLTITAEWMREMADKGFDLWLSLYAE